jgi:engulfment/cell motility protein 1
MLLNQQPITKSTTSLIQMMTEWGVRLRMLNLRWEDVDWHDLEMRVKGLEIEGREVPDREGLDEDYWYAMENEQ